jgi:uncharacterized protein YndB with AHSA1/START domain
MEMVAMSPEAMKLEKAPVVETGMLMRKPVDEVFEAFVNPGITTKFWFTDSTGPLEPGAEVRWTWSFYGVSTPVRVHEFDKNARLVIEWGERPASTTFTVTFTPKGDDATYVEIKESGFGGETGDDVVAWALGSMGGFTQALAAFKAYLDHGIVVRIVADRFPDGRHT